MFALALVGLVATTDAATSSQVVWQWDPESLVCVLRQEISASGDKIEIHRTPGNDTTGVQIIIPSHATLRDIQNARGAVSLDPGGITVTDV